MQVITLNESAPVVVRFQIEDYSDALHFVDQADRDQYDEQAIKAMCQARFDNWKAVINTPRSAPTAEEIAVQVDMMVEQQRATQSQIVALAPDSVLISILEGQAALIAEQLATVTQV